MGLFGKRRASGDDAGAAGSRREPEFIAGAGAWLVTTNVRDEVAPVAWMYREESQHPADNGWRIFSAADTQEYMDSGNPFVIMDFNEACAMEPALIGIYDLPVGSDLAVERGERITVFDVTTGRELPLV